MLKDLYPDTKDSDNKEYTIPGEFIAKNYTNKTIRFENKNIHIEYQNEVIRSNHMSKKRRK